MVLEITVKRLAERQLEPAATGHHALMQLAKREVPLVQATPAKNDRKGAVRIVAAQTLPELGQCETAIDILVQNALACQRPHQPAQRPRICAHLGGHRIAASRTLPQRVADPDASRHGDRLREAVRRGECPKTARIPHALPRNLIHSSDEAYLQHPRAAAPGKRDIDGSWLPPTGAPAPGAEAGLVAYGEVRRKVSVNEPSLPATDVTVPRAPVYAPVPPMTKATAFRYPGVAARITSSCPSRRT